jgi:4-hydroxy-tetrahydrodipicolinate reductase
MTTRVALVGGTGKLGAIIAGVIDELDDFETVAVLGSASDLAEIDAADLVVDASTPGVSIDVVRAAIERGKNVLVGTSGWSTERIALVRPLVEAAGTGAVFIPNFSLGSVVATALAAAAAPLFPSIEIVETHRETKVDSPSGTGAHRRTHRRRSRRGRPGRIAACRSAGARPAGRECSHPFVAPAGRHREAGDDPVGAGESLTIVHDTIEPARAYAPGIRVALAAARDARG